MANPYHVLGVETTASDEQIRQRYLERLRQHPPEHDPRTFQRIRAAYETIGDERARARFLIFEPSRGESFDEWIEELECETRNQRVGLERLRAIFHTT